MAVDDVERAAPVNALDVEELDDGGLVGTGNVRGEAGEADLDCGSDALIGLGELESELDRRAERSVEVLPLDLHARWHVCDEVPPVLRGLDADVIARQEEPRTPRVELRLEVADPNCVEWDLAHEGRLHGRRHERI